MTWRKVNSKEWSFDDEFFISVYRWSRECWDVELWHDGNRYSFTETFTKDRATQIAQEKMAELDTAEKLNTYWNTISGDL